MNQSTARPCPNTKQRIGFTQIDYKLFEKCVQSPESLILTHNLNAHNVRIPNRKPGRQP